MSRKFNNLKNKKVAIICPTLSRGGAERIVGLLSKQLEDHVDELIIFLFNSKEITYSYSGKIIDLNFDDSTTRSKFRFVNKLNKIIAYFKLLFRLRSEKKKNNIDISISFMDTPNILNILSKKKDKVILSVRVNKSVQRVKHDISLSKKIEMILMKILYRYSNKIIAISEGVRHDLVKNFKVNSTSVKTIYNFLDVADIQDKIDEELPMEHRDLFNNNDVIINVGRFEKQKNQINLIKSFREISERSPNARLVLLGKGTLENQIKSTINELELTDKVHLIPYTDNPFKYMSRSRLFILNSYYEGFGNVILEAMACGIPVISTDCKDGPREIISGIYRNDYNIEDVEIHKKGILIPLQDEENRNVNYVYKATHILMTDSKLREKIIREANHYLKNEFSNDEIKVQWLQEIMK